tara:strand:+ start:1608 stop:1844 length:237 start_codon:yes stop_codon:yes gene_type:complete
MELKNKAQRTQLQLNVLKDWLKDYREDCYDSNEGAVESQVRIGVETALHKVGDYLEEILEMSDRQLFEEVEFDEIELK